MTTDATERGLERLICTALTGHPCDPPQETSSAEARAGYGGAGWSGGNPHDYDREFCVDRTQLAAFLKSTQADAAESLALDEDGPARRKFLARLQGEIAKDRDRYKVAKRIQAEPVFCGFGPSAHSKVISVSVPSAAPSTCCATASDTARTT